MYRYWGVEEVEDGVGGIRYQQQTAALRVMGL